MKLIKFQNDTRRTFFAPTYEYFLGEDFITNIDFNDIRNLILEQEKNILETYPTVNRSSVDGYTGLGDNSLTSRFDYFNLFSWEQNQLNMLKREIFCKYRKFVSNFDFNPPKTWIKCWSNVMRAGEKINPHLHCVNGFTYIGGHVVVNCSNTSTFYMNPINQINDPQTYESKNSIGKITFFQQNIPHYTNIHTSSDERITIAFDLVVDSYASQETNLLPFDNGDFDEQ